LGSDHCPIELKISMHANQQSVEIAKTELEPEKEVEI
jgi:hypothetical protein